MPVRAWLARQWLNRSKGVELAFKRRTDNTGQVAGTEVIAWIQPKALFWTMLRAIPANMSGVYALIHTRTSRIYVGCSLISANASTCISRVSAVAHTLMWG